MHNDGGIIMSKCVMQQTATVDGEDVFVCGHLDPAYVDDIRCRHVNDQENCGLVQDLKGGLFSVTRLWLRFALAFFVPILGMIVGVFLAIQNHQKGTLEGVKNRNAWILATILAVVAWIALISNGFLGL